jgi:hypothetical protein
VGLCLYSHLKNKQERRNPLWCQTVFLLGVYHNLFCWDLKVPLVFDIKSKKGLFWKNTESFLVKSRITTLWSVNAKLSRTDGVSPKSTCMIILAVSDPDVSLKDMTGNTYSFPLAYIDSVDLWNWCV